MYSAALDNAMTCLNGNRVTTCVNPEVYDQPGRLNKAQQIIRTQSHIGCWISNPIARAYG